MVVLQLKRGTHPDQHAKGWTCIGWDVAVSDREFAFDAGTGTEQRTFTPETPPYMDRNPVPGTEEQPRTRLSFSPILSERLVEQNAGAYE